MIPSLVFCIQTISGHCRESGGESESEREREREREPSIKLYRKLFMNN